LNAVVGLPRMCNCSYRWYINEIRLGIQILYALHNEGFVELTEPTMPQRLSRQENAQTEDSQTSNEPDSPDLF
jgi:hypothetical protein